MDHESTKLRARIGALEAQLDALRAEYAFYGAACEADAIDVLRAEIARYDREVDRLVEERDAFRGEVMRLQTLACDAYARGQADNETAALEGIAYASDAIGKAIEELFARAVADLRVELEKITAQLKSNERQVRPWQVSVEGSEST
jgi:hypothetical protein